MSISEGAISELAISSNAETADETQVLYPSLFTNTNTFYAHVVLNGQVLTPSLFTNTNSFYTQQLNQGQVLTPSLFSNENTFFAHNLTGGEAVTASSSGGGGRWVIKKREKVRRLDEIVEQGVREAYQEITGTAPKKIQKEAAKLVRPFIEKGIKPEAIPTAENIDWVSMQRDARRVQAMLDLWQEQAMEERLMAQNDEDVLLLLAM